MAHGIKKQMLWAVLLAIPLLAIGLFFFYASMESGGGMFYASAILVPPLALDIIGVLPKANLLVWLLIVGVLQYIYCFLLVMILGFLNKAILAKGSQQ